MVVGNVGGFRALTAHQHQLDATSVSLRELEEQAERLRRLLLNGPLEAEDARRAVEARAHEVKTQLQHECDSLMAQTEELRASLKAITAENQTAQRTLDALHKGNGDAERKVAEAKRRLEEAAAEARAAAVAESERAQPLSATGSPTQTGGRAGEAALSPKHVPASTITPPAPLQLRLEEGVSAVVTLRKRHAAALAAVDKVTAELRAVVQKRSDIDAEVASLRDLRARLDAARADANVAEAQQTLRQHDELAARILEHRRDAAERVRERRGMVEHLVRGFVERSNSLTAARKRYLARLLGADAESAVAREVAHNSAVRKDAAEVLLNTSIERELLENCAAVLGQRCDDLAHRLNQELYDYTNALTLSRLSPARGRAPSESR